MANIGDRVKLKMNIRCVDVQYYEGEEGTITFIAPEVGKPLFPITVAIDGHDYTFKSKPVFAKDELLVKRNRAQE